jgi:hypothetical protein
MRTITSLQYGFATAGLSLLLATTHGSIRIYFGVLVVAMTAWYGYSVMRRKRPKRATTSR